MSSMLISSGAENSWPLAGRSCRSSSLAMTVRRRHSRAAIAALSLVCSRCRRTDAASCQLGSSSTDAICSSGKPRPRSSLIRYRRVTSSAGVEAVPGGGPHRRAQQADVVVVVQGPGRQAGGLGECADLPGLVAAAHVHDPNVNPDVASGASYSWPTSVMRSTAVPASSEAARSTIALMPQSWSPAGSSKIWRSTH